MTTTHYLLIGLGVVLVGGMLLYNYIQEQRYRRQMERMFAHKRDDPALGEALLPEGGTGVSLDGPVTRLPEPAETDTRDEDDVPSAAERAGGTRPVSDAASGSPSVPPIRAGAAPVTVPNFLRSDAGTPAAARGTPAAPPRPVVEQPNGHLDPQVEYIARLRFTNPSVAAFGDLVERLRRLGKSIRAAGLREDGTWEPLAPHTTKAYQAVELALQLADRNGPLHEADLDAFCRPLYDFATQQGGAVSCPDKKEALERARDLDAFCAQVDMLIGLNVVNPGQAGFRSEDIHSAAVAAGLQLALDGTYQLRGATGQPLFTVTNQEQKPFPGGGAGLVTQGVTLLFDVPRVANGLDAFDRMTRFGFDLAARLGGRLVDDNGRAVSPDSLQRDRARLAELHALMEARAVPAGGERALRLFA